MADNEVREIVVEAVDSDDVPNVRILDGPVRVQVWKGTNQSDAISAIEYALKYVQKMSRNDWQRDVG
jgi:hypothetical protein